METPSTSTFVVAEELNVMVVDEPSKSKLRMLYSDVEFDHPWALIEHHFDENFCRSKCNQYIYS